MKKFLLIIFTVNILLSTFIFLGIKDDRQKENITGSIGENTILVTVNPSINGLNREDAFNKLQETVVAYEGSIAKTIYATDIQGRSTITRYVYLNNTDNYFNQFDWSGTPLDVYDGSTHYLTSANEKTEDAIGVVYMGKIGEVCEIRPLNQLPGTLGGNYQVSVNDKEGFLKALKSNLGTGVTEIDVEEEFFVLPILRTALLGAPVLFLYIIALVTVIYSLFFRYRKIGLKKLNGYSPSRISFSIWLEILGTAFVSVIIALGILFLFFRDQLGNILIFESLKESIFLNGIVLGIVLIVLAFPLILVDRMTITAMLKDLMPAALIGRWNSILKVIMVSVLMALFALTFMNFKVVHSFDSTNAVKWEESRHYASVPLKYGNPEETDAEYAKRAAISKQLYIYANEQGGILIDIPYKTEEEKALEISKNIGKKSRDLQDAEEQQKRDLLLSQKILIASLNGITVNNNYLAQNPIYNVDGNLVAAGEDENILYVLIPEKYQGQMEDIVSAYEATYFTQYRLPTEKLSTYYPDLFTAERPVVQPVIVKNGQSYFTYAMEAFGEDDNYIMDPVVAINTNRIESAGDISPTRGFYIYSEDTMNPFSSIRERVGELDGEAFYDEAYNVYDTAESFVQGYELRMNDMGILLLITIYSVLMLYIMTGLIYSEKVKTANTMKLMEGYGFFSRHGKLFVKTAILYIVLLVIAYVLPWTRGDFVIYAAVIGLLFLIECGIVLGITWFKEFQGTGNILRGGD